MKYGFCFFVFLVLLYSGPVFAQSENPKNIAHLNIANGFYLVLEEANESNQLNPAGPDEVILPYTLEHLGVNGQPARYFRLKNRPEVPFALEDQPVVGDKVEGKTTLNMVLGTGSAEMFRKFTAANIDKTVAIIVGSKVVTAHKIRCEITGGKIQITRCGDDACQTLYFWLKDAVK